MKNHWKHSTFTVLIATLAIAALIIACEQPTDPIMGTVATPTATPPAGTYTTAQIVTLSTTTTGAAIYYTLDGSTPGTASMLFNSSFLIAHSSVLKAIAVKDGMNDSSLLTAEYTINNPDWDTVATPTADLPEETYATAQTITLSCTTAGASIYYSLDGSAPEILFESPITISQSTTLKAIAKNDGMNDSAVLTAVYTINLTEPAECDCPNGTEHASDEECCNAENCVCSVSGVTTETVAAPTAVPAGETYYEAQTITLYCDTPGANIYYTLDGTNPSANSNPYTSPIGISQTTTLKIIAVKDGMNDSGIMEETYTINEPVIKSFIVTTDEELKEAITEVSARNGTYDITVIGSLNMEPSSLDSGSMLTLKGGATESSVTLNGAGSLISVQAGNSLILDKNITLKGHNANTGSLVTVAGTLTMKEGSKITGNANTASYANGGGVNVTGTFYMDGGEISGCSAEWSGGGVSVSDEYLGDGVYTGGSFTMRGGKIVNNAAENEGGGVYVGAYAMFVLEDSEISGNTAGNGGGVSTHWGYNSDPSFIMKNGKIVNNKTEGVGGGVYAGRPFTMDGGEISYNTAGARGGGVYCSFGRNEYFIMKGGKITNNTLDGAADGPSSKLGSGVYMESGSFSIENGEISGNIAETEFPHSRFVGGIFMNGWYSKLIMKNAKVINNIGGGVVFLTSSDNECIFTMENSEISGNSSYGVYGIQWAPGTITMKDSKISNNTNSGVVISNFDGNFTMISSEISDNVTYNFGAGIDTGGVYIKNGTGAVFTMEDGSSISGNHGNYGNEVYEGTIPPDNYWGYSVMGGGGLSIAGNNNTFIMKNGSKISNNTGGGVAIVNTDIVCEDNTEISDNDGVGLTVVGNVTFDSNNKLRIFGNNTGISVYEGTLTMEPGSKITGNGRGINLEYNATFIMNGGEISGNNNLDGNGGGVRVGEGGTFIMKGGEIYGNTTRYAGGGVFLNDNEPALWSSGSYASFTKEGGIIYGSGSGDKSNTASYGYGYYYGNAVYAGSVSQSNPSTPLYYRNTDVTADQTLHIRYEAGIVVEKTGDWND